MPQKSWAVGEEVLAADFNSYVQNQVCPAFTNAAQRDSQWAAPPNGATCVTVDTGTLWQRIGGTWYTPFRRLGLVTRTTNGPATTAEAVCVSLTGVVVPAGRLLRVVASFRAATGTSGEYITVKIREGTTTTGTWLTDMNNNMASAGMQVGSCGGLTVEYLYPTASTAGTKSWSFNYSGNSNVTMLANSTGPIYLAAYDEGAF